MFIWNLATNIINQLKLQRLDWEMQRPMFLFTTFSARILSTTLKDCTPKFLTTETLEAFLSLLWAIKPTKFIAIWAHLVCEIREKNEKKWKKRKEVFFIKFNNSRLMRKIFKFDILSGSKTRKDVFLITCTTSFNFRTRRSRIWRPWTSWWRSWVRSWFWWWFTWSWSRSFWWSWYGKWSWSSWWASR